MHLLSVWGHGLPKDRVVTTERRGKKKQTKSLGSCGKNGKNEQGIALNLTGMSGKSSSLIVVASYNFTHSVVR